MPALALLSAAAAALAEAERATLATSEEFSLAIITASVSMIFCGCEWKTGVWSREKTIVCVRMCAFISEA